MVKCLFVGASAREGRGRLVLMQGWDSNTDGCIFLQKTHTLPPIYITKYTGKSKIPELWRSPVQLCSAWSQWHRLGLAAARIHPSWRLHVLSGHCTILIVHIFFSLDAVRISPVPT